MTNVAIFADATVAQRALIHGAQFSDSRLGSYVQVVCTKCRTPIVKGALQEKPLGLRVNSGSLDLGAAPGPTDFHAAIPGINIEIATYAHDFSCPSIHHCKGILLAHPFTG